MSGNDLGGLIITGVLGLLFIIMGIVLLSGKGAFLIAGYNTMPKDEKQKYDSIALCKFMGKIILPIGVITPFLAIGNILNIGWTGLAYCIIVVVLVVFAVIYTNTGNRFNKPKK